MKNLTSDVINALEADSGQERVFLVALEFSSTTLYLSTGSRPLDWDGHTWLAVGGAFALGAVHESGDPKGAGVDFQLSGIDQTVVALLLAEEYRGRSVQAWQVFLNRTTGDVDGTMELFDGLQLDSYEVEEVVRRGQPITVTIKTRGRHRLSVNEWRGIRCNVHSHQHYYPGDTFMRYVSSLANRKIFWGTGVPTTPGGGGGSGGGDDFVPRS